MGCLTVRFIPSSASSRIVRAHGIATRGERRRAFNTMIAIQRPDYRGTSRFSQARSSHGRRDQDPPTPGQATVDLLAWTRRRPSRRGVLDGGNPMRTLVRLALVGLTLAAPAVAADLRIERVFGPETPTGRYKHPACLTELDSGDLYLVYYGGSGEYATETAVFGSRLKKGEETWSAPTVLARDPFRSVGNGVIWQAPDGLVWLFYVVRWGDTWSTSRIQAKISRDGAKTWSDSFVVTEEEGTMV